MKTLIAHPKLLMLVACIALFAGCKQPETIVVEESPTAAAPSDTTVQEGPESNEASFRKLVMGEYNQIPTLDPLFADNASSMRTIQLMYEGLVRLDAGGSVVPGMATDWEISSDSLQYTFTLRKNTFYHDSDVFSTGTGRRMVSSDVKFVFQRMARAGVPPKAAHLFMNIKGFDPYYHEQREVYNPADRKLDGISGIQTPSDSTVVFELNEPDPQFLKKLATPLAVIYPQEAVGETVASFSPVGTGPLQFSSRDADSTLIFSKFQNYYAASDVQLNRVDIVTDVSESSLFRSMSTGDIYVMPQLGPQQLQNLITSNGNLYESYAKRYNLQITSGATEFALRYYPNANLSERDATAIAAIATADSASYFDEFPNSLVTTQTVSDTINAPSDPSNLAQQIYTVFSEDPYIRTYLGKLSSTLSQYDVSLQMMEIRAPSRNTGLLFSQSYPLIPDQRWNSYKALLQFRVHQAALYRSEISGLDFNAYPWWFNVRGVTLPASESLN